jgi:hypothetical protein
VTTLAGLAGSAGSADGIGSAARFNQPGGIAVDNTTGVVYVADSFNNTIRRIEPRGIVTTIAGLAGTSGSADGLGSAARFNNPTALATDNWGIVYVADTGNHTIRSITPSGVVTTIAGLAGAAGSIDGTGTAARFNAPQGIALEGAWIYVVDTNNQTIRRITAGNVVTTIAGCPGCFGGEDEDRFNAPQGIALDWNGFLYVADSRNNTIRTTAPLATSLVIDFGPGNGIWLRRGTDWRQVHPSSAKALMVLNNRSGDALIADFGPGVGIWVYEREADGDDSWVPIHYLSADAMVGIDSDGDGETDSAVFSFAGQGLWSFNRDTKNWTQLHATNPLHLASANLDAVGGDELIADFAGYGLWVYSAGAWSQVHPFDVSTMTTGDLYGSGRQDLIVNFPGFGVWAYRNRTTWESIHPLDAQRIATADFTRTSSDPIIDFGPSFGVWWRHIGPPKIYGLFWTQISESTTENMVTVDLDGDGLDEIIVDFGHAGVWSFDSHVWTIVDATNPKSIVTGRLR